MQKCWGAGEKSKVKRLKRLWKKDDFRVSWCKLWCFFMHSSRTPCALSLESFLVYTLPIGDSISICLAEHFTRCDFFFKNWFCKVNLIKIEFKSDLIFWCFYFQNKFDVKFMMNLEEFIWAYLSMFCVLGGSCVALLVGLSLGLLILWNPLPLMTKKTHSPSQKQARNCWQKKKKQATKNMSWSKLTFLCSKLGKNSYVMYQTTKNMI